MIKMSLSVKKCCVPGCPNRESKGDTILHKFPNPQKEQEQFKVWLYRIGGDILASDIGSIYKLRRVCHIHFEEKYHTQSKKKTLRYDAIPTLNLPGFYALLKRKHSLSELHTDNNPCDIKPATSSEPTPAKIIFLQDITNMDMTCQPGPSTSSDAHRKNPTTILASSTAIKDLPKTYKGSKARRKLTLTPENTLLQTQMEKVIKSKENVKKRVKKAINLTKNAAFQKALHSFSTAAFIFLSLQFREIRKNKMGRRFTDDEKVLSLSLYKQGPKAYKWLRKIFVLPSPLTLSRMITAANLKPGLNENLFKALKQRVKKMKKIDKVCMLLFDEISLTPHLDYNTREDRIIGFVHNGHNTTKRIADHALVFMIRGVYRNYKQPVAYTFCEGSTKTDELKRQIREIIQRLQSIGLVVAATVCDQGSNNVSAIKSLLEDTKSMYLRKGEEYKGRGFEINGHEVVPLYDPPHLIKGIRNNLLNKDLKCTIDGKVITGKWEHVIEFFEKNPTYKGIKLVPKLTERHVIPKKIAKMKVKCATQVFSTTLAVQMGYLAENGVLRKEMRETAEILLFFDELFDSFNGSFPGSKRKPMKILLHALTKDSKHRAFWMKAKQVLKSMRFLGKKEKYTNVPSIQNWLMTIVNMEYLYETLSKANDFKSMWLRHFNQDPLENFFGSIRSHGYRNTSPSCLGFQVAFSALLINNLNSLHTEGFNCEKDSCFAFKSLKKLFFSKNEKTQCLINEVNFEHIDCRNIIVGLKSKERDLKVISSIEYVAGYIYRKLRTKIFQDCVTCRQDFLDEKSSRTSFIKIREYTANSRHLTYVTEPALSYFSDCQDVIYYIMKENSHILNIKEYIKTILCLNVNYSFISCQVHKKQNADMLENSVCNLFLFTWAKNTNKLLNGKSSNYEEGDSVQKMAYEYYTKRNKK